MCKVSNSKSFPPVLAGHLSLWLEAFKEGCDSDSFPLAVSYFAFGNTVRSTVASVTCVSCWHNSYIKKKTCKCLSWRVTLEAVHCSNTKPLPSQTTLLADHTIWQRKCLCMQESLLLSLYSQLQLLWILSLPHWKSRNRGHSWHVPQWNQLFAQSHLPISALGKNEQCTGGSKSRTFPEPNLRQYNRSVYKEAVTSAARSSEANKVSQSSYTLPATYQIFCSWATRGLSTERFIFKESQRKTRSSDGNHTKRRTKRQILGKPRCSLRRCSTWNEMYH